MCQDSFREKWGGGRQRVTRNNGRDEPMDPGKKGTYKYLRMQKVGGRKEMYLTE